MNLVDAAILGFLQGVTEFLPVSSSGHLVLGEEFLKLNVEMLKSFDVAVHVASLLAIAVYFWKDVVNLFKAFLGFFVGRFDGFYSRLIVWILVGTVPAVVVGLLFEDVIDGAFRNVLSVGWWMIGVGFLFLVGEFVYKKYLGRGVQMGWRRALVIGLAQAFALIPGVSRSGSTIVAGLFQGVKREEAARFSFLLGMPAIFGAALLTAIDGGGFVFDSSLLVGFVTSFLASLASVWFLMKFLKKHSLAVFAVYLILVGGFVLLFSDKIL